MNECQWCKERFVSPIRLHMHQQKCKVRSTACRCAEIAETHVQIDGRLIAAAIRREFGL